MVVFNVSEPFPGFGRVRSQSALFAFDHHQLILDNMGDSPSSPILPSPEPSIPKKTAVGNPLNTQIVSLIIDNLKQVKAFKTIAGMMRVSKSTYEIAGPALYDRFTLDEKTRPFFRLLLPSRYDTASEDEKKAIEVAQKEREEYYLGKVSHSSWHPLQSIRLMFMQTRLPNGAIARYDLAPLLDDSPSLAIPKTDTAWSILLKIRRLSALLARITYLHCPEPTEEDGWKVAVDLPPSKTMKLCLLRPHTSLKIEDSGQGDHCFRLAWLLIDIQYWTDPEILCFQGDYTRFHSLAWDDDLELSGETLDYLFFASSWPRHIRLHDMPDFVPEVFCATLRIYDGLSAGLHDEPARVIRLDLEELDTCVSEYVEYIDVARNRSHTEYSAPSEASRLRAEEDAFEVRLIADTRKLMRGPLKAFIGKLRFGVSEDIKCGCVFDDSSSQVCTQVLIWQIC